MKKNIFISILFSLFIVSCSNLTDGMLSSKNNEAASSDKKIYVTGTLNFSGAIPSEMEEFLKPQKDETFAKSAIPSVPAGVKYFVTAECTGKSTITVEAVYNATLKKYEFSMGLSDGNWTITATLKADAGTTDEKILLSDSITKNLLPGNTTISLEFYLKPLSEGTGTVIVPVNVYENEITCKLKPSWTSGKGYLNDSLISMTRGVYNLTINNSAADLIITFKEVPCGSYELLFNFYKNGVLLYSTTQTVNVFANMTTDKWTSNRTDGSADIISENKIKLKSSLANSYARKTFYVDGINGSDSGNTGGPYSPLKSLSKAVEKVNESTQTGTHNIYVKAGSTETLTASISPSKDVNIEVYTEAPGDKTGTYTLTRSNSSSSSFRAQMIKNIEKTVSLSGLTIDGNNYPGGSIGMGIFHRDGTLNLINCNINNFTTSMNGGGLYINGGTVNFISGCIGKIDATETATSTSYSNKAAEGGGVYVRSGTLNIGSNASIKYNFSNSEKSGPAIYNEGGTVNIEGEVSYNFCSNSSNNYLCGAIYNIKNLTINNGKFVGNCYTPGVNAVGYAITQDNAGSANSITISGSTWFDSSNIIFLNDNQTITVNDNLTPKDLNGNSKDITAQVYVKSSAAGTVVLKSSSENYISQNCDKFAVTSNSMIISPGTADAAAKKTGVLKNVLYVSGSGHSSNLPDGNNSSGDGSKIKPYATLTQAISKVEADGTIIYVDGETTETSGITIAGTNHSFSVVKAPGAASATCKYTGSSVYIHTSKSLTINGVDFDGNNTARCAFWIQNSGVEVEIIDSKIINFNPDADYGCITVTASGSVSLKGTSQITTSVSGPGILVKANTCNVKLQDSVYLNSSNYIKLESGAKVTVTGNLTPPLQANGVTAYINPVTKNINTIVLAGSTSALLTGSVSKFRIAGNTSPYWYITTQGELDKITNYIEGSELIYSVDDLNKKISAQNNNITIGRNETVFVVNDLENVPNIFLEGKLLIPAEKTITMKFNKTYIYAKTTNCQIGSLDGGTLILDGQNKDGNDRGLLQINQSVTMHVYNTTIKNAKSTSRGAGIKFTGPDINLHMTNCTIMDCTSSQYGGAIAIYTSGNVYLNACAFSGNSAFDGGCIYDGNSVQNKIYLDLEDSVTSATSFASNSAGRNGGAFYLTDAHVIYNSSLNPTFSGNTASTLGNNVYTSGTCKFGRSTSTTYDESSMTQTSPW